MYNMQSTEQLPEMHDRFLKYNSKSHDTKC